MKHIKINYDEDDDELLNTLQRQESEEEDEYTTLSLGSLNAAQKSLSKDKGSKDKQKGPSQKGEEFNKRAKRNNEGDRKRRNNEEEKKKNKHAPAETSSKRPVSKIRKIEGLEKSTLYQDIRFDEAFGKADLQETRKNYGFLDEYRQNEINELNRMIRDKKTFSKLSYKEQEEAKFQLQSLKSRMDTLKTRDIQHKVLDDYKQEQLRNVREGKQANPYYLKRSEQRKLLQTVKFQSMKPGQREKVMERKRKRKLGKEFKQLEFRNNQ